MVLMRYMAAHAAAMMLFGVSDCRIILLLLFGPTYPAGPAPTMIKSTSSDIVVATPSSYVALFEIVAIVSLQR
jgi:hypothetical protein